MDFEISNVIDAPAQTVAEALLDAGYQKSLHDIGALRHRELLAQEELDDGRVRRRVRCVLDIQLNSSVRRFIGEGDPAWVEESTWIAEKMTWEWDIHPELGGDLLSARGTIELEDRGDATNRHVRGHVKVSVPIYGGRVEGWIVDGLERAYEEEAERLEAWVTNR